VLLSQAGSHTSPKSKTLTDDQLLLESPNLP
jgi:hypothetical protein